MKTLNKISLLGVVALALWTCNASAQNAPSSAQPSENGGKCGKAGKHGKKSPMKKLNLSDDQKAKVGPILQKAREDAKAVKRNDALTPEQKKQQIDAIRQNKDQQLQTVLTPEQYQQLQEIKANRKEKHSKGDKAPAPATT